MAQLLQLKHKGLFTSPNEFSAVPEGALITANNIVIDVDQVAESRRGFDRAYTLPNADDRISRFAVYQDTLLAAWNGSTVGYLNSSAFVALSGTYSHPDSSLARLRFLTANNNLYFTTSSGIYKMDAYNATPTLAGIPKGLDIEVSLSGSSGFLATANQTGYRVIWGIKDAQNNIVTGAPSGRAVAINSSGGDRDVSLTVTIPSGITTSHFFQVYRSKASGGVAVSPDDELGLVYENNPTSGEISTGYLTVVDRTTDDLRGQTLYTSPSQEGISQSNERPPQADYIEEFQSSVIYGNCKSKHRKIFTILAVGGSAGIAINDTVTIAGTVYTAKGTETIASGYFSAPSATATTTTGDTTSGNNVLTNVASTAGCKIGWKISGTDIPAGSYISAFTSTTITMVTSDGTTASNATGSTAGVTFSITANIGPYSSTTITPAQAIADTATSLIRVINRYSSNTLVYAYYLSAETDLPGQILIEERGLGGNSFALLASARSTAYNPALPTSGTTVSSTNDDFQNQIMIAKPGKAESVPLANFRRVGSANTPILGLAKLRNTLFIFKGKEGIYRMTGTDPNTFSVELMDSSAKLLAPDSIAVVNNQIWCLCDQGITVITETGVSVISRPIEDLLLDQFGTALTAVKYYSFGVGYESDRKYILWTVSTSADTYGTQAFVFNVFTQGYTKWTLAKRTAIVNPTDDKLYLADGASYYTDQERKNRNYTDYVDYGITTTITSASTYTVYLGSTSEVEVGDLLYQSASVQSLITAVEAAYVTVEDNITWSIAACTVYKGINCEIEYAAVTGSNPGLGKQFPEIAMLFKAARFNTATLSFASDNSAYFESVSISGSRAGLWGLFGWGDSPWGGVIRSTAIRALVPLEKQHASYLRIKFTHRQGYGYFKLNGFSLPVIFTDSYDIGT
jgi:hypothetical protein